MALFFDSAWFDARLAASHLSRADVARALGVSESELAEIWKDQRELSARDVSVLAALLAVDPAEIANRAGISTPVPKSAAAPGVVELADRLKRVEDALTRVEALLNDMKDKE